jgi:hypothetical protein
MAQRRDTFIYINRGMQEGCINLLDKYFNEINVNHRKLYQRSL